MKVLKHAILTLILFNLPTFSFFYLNQAIGGITSYMTYVLLLAFYFFYGRDKINVWVLIIGLTYFTISGLNFHSGTEREYITFFIKNLILITAGSSFVKHVKENELFYYLLVGSASIIVHSLLFPDNFGRYSGFYFNSNLAGFIAIMVYALTFSIKGFTKRSLLQGIITIAGILTFSRTFILLWILTNLISLRISVKNLRIIGISIGLLAMFLLFAELFNANTLRLRSLTALVNNEQGAINKASQGSRTETWSLYYDYILEKPLFGNGFGSFQRTGFHDVAVHNSYLLVLGEAGIIPFVLLIGLFFYMALKSFRVFKTKPFLLMLNISLLLFLLTFHNFFSNDQVLLMTLWIYYQIKRENTSDV